jgi:hypothetical protein
MKPAMLLVTMSFAVCAYAATPAQEKAFVDTYRKAYEAKDEKTLVSLLYTKGADPAALAFYKMMVGAEMGGNIDTIELVDLSAEDRKHVDAMQSPDGRPAKLVMPPSKKLVVKTSTKDKNGSSSSKSEVFVGESDGKLYILLPAAR